ECAARMPVVTPRRTLRPDDDLAPVAGAAARAVWRVDTLGDDRSAPSRSRLVVERAPVAGDEFAEAHRPRARVGQDVLQVGSPGGERQRPKVFVAVAKSIEGDERRPARVDGDNGTVEEHGGLESAAQIGEGPNDVRKSGALVSSSRRPYMYAPTAHTRLDG